MIKALDTAGARKHQLLSSALSLDAAPQVQTPPDTDEVRCTSPYHELVQTSSRLFDPLTALLAREQLDGIIAGLPALTVKEHAALTGTLNGKTQQQLADEHGSTRKAVKAALRRARHKLAAPEALAT